MIEIKSDGPFMEKADQLFPGRVRIVGLGQTGVAVCDQLIDDTRLGGNARVTVDLARQVVIRPNGEEIGFEIDPFRKYCLLNGLDDIGLTLRHEAELDKFESKHDAEFWLAPR